MGTEKTDMKSTRSVLALLLVSSLACNFVTRAFGRDEAPVTPPPSQLAPAFIPPGCESVPVATIPPATQLAQPTQALEANPEVASDTQLRVFEAAVHKIEEVYVYPDFNGVDWPAIVAAHRARLESGLDTEAYYAEMRALVEELGDDHSHFESPVEVAISDTELAGSGEFVGIGVSVLPQSEKNHAAIILVFPDSPAEHAGLKAHDSILAVDGLPIVQGEDLFIERVRGPECSAARITVQSPGEAPRDVLVMRHHISGGLPIEARLVNTTDGSRIGYIMLPSFFDQTIPGKVSAALTDFGELDGLILDNRLNGGGSSSVVEPILSFFTSGTPGSFKSRRETRPLTIDPNPIQNSQTVPLVILVGEDTVSFGEIFSGALKDFRPGPDRRPDHAGQRGNLARLRLRRRLAAVDRRGDLRPGCLARGLGDHRHRPRRGGLRGLGCFHIRD